MKNVKELEKEFESLRNDDPDFKNMYNENEFSRWIQDNDIVDQGITYTEEDLKNHKNDKMNVNNEVDRITKAYYDEVEMFKDIKRYLENLDDYEDSANDLKNYIDKVVELKEGRLMAKCKSDFKEQFCKCDCNKNYGNKDLQGVHDIDCETKQDI